MESIDTSSNTSGNSDLSSLSGLSELEDDLLNIGSLKVKTISLSSNKGHGGGDAEVDVLPDCFTKFNTELMKVLELNEKYKKDLITLEHELEQKYIKKINELSKYNSDLEERLAKSNSEIEYLIEKDASTSEKQKSLDYELEQKVVEAKSIRSQVSHLEVTNNALKCKNEALKLELNTKTTSISELKTKIVELQIAIQSLNSKTSTLQNELHIQQNNFETLKKSELFYKEQLNKCREKGSSCAQELAYKEDKLIIVCNENHRLNSLLDGQKLRKCVEKSSTVIDIPAESCEQTIANLKTELSTLKNAINVQKKSFDNVVSRNSELQNYNSELLEIVKNEQLAVANLTNENHSIKCKYQSLESQIQQYTQLLTASEDEKCILEFALHESEKEKQNTQSAINHIRTDFRQFVENYQTIKAELIHTKTCVAISDEENHRLERNNKKLEKDLKTIQDRLITVEKDDMLAKQKIAQLKLSLESTQDTSSEENKQLEDQITTLKNKLCKIEIENKNFENEVKDLKNSTTKNEQFEKVQHRLKLIVDKCQYLEENVALKEEEISVLRSLNTTEESECVKNLKALCDAKDLELKEKQKKFDCHYRTLIRKVKENIQTRKGAEKRFVELEQLYNDAFKQLSSYKLKESSNDMELSLSQSKCKQYFNIIKQKDNEIENIRKKVNILMMGKDVNVTSFKNTISLLEDQVLRYKTDSNEKEGLINNLKLENDQRQTENDELNHTIQHYAVQIEQLKQTVDEKKKLLAYSTEVQAKLSEKCNTTQQEYSECTLKLEDTSRLLHQLELQNTMLIDDINNFTTSSVQKNKKLADMSKQKHGLENKAKEQEEAMYKLQYELHSVQNSLSKYKSDKYFLQRLCNDLKFALTTLKNQNHALRKHVESLCLEHSSLPKFEELPSPNEVDEAHVNALIEQSIDVPVEQPLAGLHSSLNLLKLEMAALRKQVVENSKY